MTRSAHDVLERVRSLALLAGGLRPSALRAGAGRSLLDLPVRADPYTTLLDVWREEISSLAGLLEPSPIPVRLILDPEALAPASLPGDDRVRFELERDPREYRGTAGILRDILCPNEETVVSSDDYVLVASALELPLASFRDLVRELAAPGADVAVAAHADGTPSSVKLVRCECLRVVPDIGYADFKEQALPVMAEKFDVKVVTLSRPSSAPVRDLGDYLAALRALHEIYDPATAPFAEEWGSRFSIVEEGADVDPSATLHDAVVLRGARVGAGAFVARSLIGPGGAVPAGETVVNSLIATAD